MCEQAHQQLKQELGLGHFEGRSWTGLHRHALMACVAFAYLQHLRLKTVRRRGEKAQAALGRKTAAAAELARRAPSRHGKALRAARRTGPMSALQPRNHRRRPAVNHNGIPCRSPPALRSWALRDVMANVTSGNATVYAGAFRAAADSRGARS